MADIFFGTLAVLLALVVAALVVFAAMVAINMSKLTWKVPKPEERDKYLIDAFRVAVKLQPLVLGDAAMPNQADLSNLNQSQATLDMNAYYRLYHVWMKVTEDEVRVFTARMSGPHAMADQVNLTFR